jgi:ketosteroid isomerase-like protein
MISARVVDDEAGRITMFAVIALALWLGTAPLPAQSGTLCTTPRDACEFFDAYLAAFNRRDWEAFRATFADDITVMFDGSAVAERRDGRAAVEEAFRRVFPKPGAEPPEPPSPLQPANLRVQDLGEVVIISFHLRAPAGVSRRTVVLQRRAGGWRVVHIHASSLD